MRLSKYGRVAKIFEYPETLFLFLLVLLSIIGNIFFIQPQIKSEAIRYGAVYKPAAPTDYIILLVFMLIPAALLTKFSVKSIRKTLIFILGIILLFFFYLIFIALKTEEYHAPVFFSLEKDSYNIANYTSPDGIYLVCSKEDCVPVVSSPIKLDKFMGKKVKIEGKYSGQYYHQVCIAEKCIQGGSLPGVEIYQIHEVN